MESLFATHQTTFTRVAVSHLKIERDRASARAVCDMTLLRTESSGGRTPNPSRSMRFIRTFAFVREGGRWQIRRYYPAAEDLAAALLAAGSEAAQNGLLAADPDLVTGELTQVLQRQGNGYRDGGDSPGALAAFHLWQRVAAQLGDRLGAATALHELATLHYGQGSFARALDFYEQGLKLREELGARWGVAATLINIGMVRAEQGNYPEALSALQRGLALAEELGHKQWIARALNLLGVVHRSQDRYVEALQLHRRSLKLGEELEDRTVIADALSGLGLAHSAQGSFIEALRFYERALKLREEVAGRTGGDKAALAGTLINIGLGHLSLGGYARALRELQRGLALAEEANHRPWTAHALNNIGLLYQSQGNYAQALALYERSRSLYEEVGDRAGLAGVRVNTGFAHLRGRHYGEALDGFHQGLALAEEVGHRRWASRALGGIGQVHYSQGDHVRALQFYERGLQLREALGDRGGIPVLLNCIAQVYSSQGRHREALDRAGRAAVLAEEVGAADSVWRAQAIAGNALRALDQPGPARRSLEQAIAIVESMRGQVAGGDQEQQQFFAARVDPYDAMVELLAAQDQPAEAFAYAERARAKVLRDILHGGRVDLAGTMTPEQRERESGLRADCIALNGQLLRVGQQPQPDRASLAALQASLRKARLEYDAFRTELYASTPGLQARRGESPALTAAQAADWLRREGAPGTLVLEYVVTQDSVLLLTLDDAGRSSTRRLPQHPTALRKAVAALRAAIRRKEAGELGALAQMDAALRPLNALLPAALLAGKRRVCIVPDDMLWEVPFPALKLPSGRYLVEECAVSYAPSLTALKVMSEQSRRQRDARRGYPGARSGTGVPAAAVPAAGGSRSGPRSELLAMAPFAPPKGQSPGSKAAGPTREVALRGTFGALAASEQEVAALARLYGAKPYQREQAIASRAKAEAPRARILHFATHGLFDAAQGMYSGVVLAAEDARGQGDKGAGGLGDRSTSNSNSSSNSNSKTPNLSSSIPGSEDGILEAWEVADLRLSAELAVLSACETARGEISQGEGVIGLSWAFFVAGCPSTLVSQWKVNDASTATLMTAFHRSLKSGRDKSEALRQAQLSLLRAGRTRHPYYWAPFTLVGAWR